MGAVCFRFERRVRHEWVGWRWTWKCGNIICRNSSWDVVQDEGIAASSAVIPGNFWRHNALDACYRSVNLKTLCNSASEPGCHKPLVAGANPVAATTRVGPQIRIDCSYPRHIEPSNLIPCFLTYLPKRFLRLNPALAAEEVEHYTDYNEQHCDHNKEKIVMTSRISTKG